ncbi:alkaline phosphatase [Helicobacter sp. 13S00401-1]|uniref:DedA family protein n=1 Tax=Helicobacter sp. 13S00401-1 TaxID=1905758 RepID=UPI000BA75CAD|nr:DedA family protein [Helicobacter sp. 13S00401-1]PAF50055.1 alkaline phosphatase [Helicobacter sp. 13S00401-1]
MVASVLHFIIHIIDHLGYIGIFILMAIESSFIPLPSEVVMIPAGYLAYQGEMSMPILLIVGALGSLFGALINYYIAFKFGRFLVLKYGKYVLIKESTLIKTEVFFQKYGSVSIFVARFLPVLRHYISLPAGLARMSLWKFCFFTFFGAFLWVCVLSYFGYYLGHSLGNIHSVNEIAGAFVGSSKDSLQSSIKQKASLVIYGVIAIIIIVGIVTTLIIKYKKTKKLESKN